jgi:hypothetical protein
MNSMAIKISALIVIVLWLSIAIAVTFADAPPSTPTAITISLSTNSVALGNSLTVNGSITPSTSGLPAVSGVTVTLTYTKPDGTTSTATVTTGTDGSFSDSYTPNVAGSWSIQASCNNLCRSIYSNSSFRGRHPHGIFVRCRCNNHNRNCSHSSLPVHEEEIICNNNLRTCNPPIGEQCGENTNET